MLDFAGKVFKAAIVSMFKELKKKQTKDSTNRDYQNKGNLELKNTRLKDLLDWLSPRLKKVGKKNL